MTTLTTEPRADSAHRPMGFPEFVLIVAAIMALNPLAMDMMLPALPNIGATFQISDANRLQSVLSVYMLGFGLGQFAIGPLTDRFGRRPVLLAGIAMYCVASVLAIMATTFETLLMARLVQGLGTATTRVIATSVVRDCYSGRRMASVMSLTTIVFMAVPVLAPAFGQMVMLLSRWQGIFIVLTVCGVLMLAWSALRLPETLPPAARKSIAIRDVLGAYRQTICNRQTLGYALAAGGAQAALFAYIFNSQQIFTEIFRLGVYFPLAFAGIAVGIAIAGFCNSQLVGRFGMRMISHGALIAQTTICIVLLVAQMAGMLSLPLFLALSVLLMFCFGMMFSNFTALAMEPQGHIAGTASSMYGSVTTLIGVGLGYAISQRYNDTLTPLLIGFLLCSFATLAVVLIFEKGRLFRAGR